jgi:predicted alpha-1,2-mannosidase
MTIVRRRSGGRGAALAAALLAVVPAAAAAPALAVESDPAALVDPMIGTAPPGFVFPGAAVPFGMVQNSPDTRGQFAYSGYLATDPAIQGFSLVHLSGPGAKKGGDLPFMPTLGPSPSNEPSSIQSTFSHGLEHAEAGYYRVHLDVPATDVELTAARHAAMQRYTFPPSPSAYLIADVSRSVEGVHDGTFKVTGPAELSGSARGRYPVFFVARFSRPFAGSGTFRAEGHGAGGWVRWDTTAQRVVTARIGVSFVDVAGARRNLDRDAPTFDFAGMRANARAEWRAALSRIRVSGGTDADKKSFYTALYHAQLHPNVFTDVDGRYRGFDHRVHAATGRTQYANFSLWDTYKGENQLLALIQPARYHDMLLSLLDDYRLGGRLPRWGEQDFDASHMSGDPAIQMIVDGYCRGLVAPGEAGALYGAALDLTRRREPDLARLGYLPVDHTSRGAGTTLEYGIADFALALMADRLGHPSDAIRLLQDSLRYRKLLDPDTRFIRPRESDGSWMSPFDPTDEKGFQEGNAWQYSWLAPHDARGLFEAMGGEGAAAAKLDNLFKEPPEAQKQQNVFGLFYRTDQYAPGNEHDLQVPWMYPFARQPWKTQAELRALQALFRPTSDGLPGNDDLGGLSGWHVFSALGFGPVTPGAPFYVVGSPQFEHATIDVPGRRPFTVDAPGSSLTSKYVRSARLGGRPLGRAWFGDAAVRAGGSLVLAMTDQPNTGWGTAGPDRPPSATGSPLAAFGCTPRELPRIALSVSPSEATVGHRVRFRFLVTTGAAARRVADAHVNLAGHRTTTDSRGRASLELLFHVPARYRPRASKAGFHSGRASVTVNPAMRRD